MMSIAFLVCTFFSLALGLGSAHADNHVALVMGNQVDRPMPTLQNPERNFIDIATSPMRLGSEPTVIESADLGVRPRFKQVQGFDLRASQQDVTVAQRAVLYEEDPGDPQGKSFRGSATWRTDTISPGPGLATELVVRADIEIPDRNVTMTLSLRHNLDTRLPASHVVEIIFKLPADFASGGILNVPGILLKPAEQSRGVPLKGLSVKVTNGFFMVGLSSVEADKEHNLKLLKEQRWFDIPIIYSNNRRAILALEKGISGERAFSEAFAEWQN